MLFKFKKNDKFISIDLKFKGQYKIKKESLKLKQLKTKLLMKKTKFQIMKINFISSKKKHIINKCNNQKTKFKKI